MFTLLTLRFPNAIALLVNWVSRRELLHKWFDGRGSGRRVIRKRYDVPLCGEA